MKKRMLYFVIAFITSFGFTAVQAQAQAEESDKESYFYFLLGSGEIEDSDVFVATNLIYGNKLSDFFTAQVSAELGSIDPSTSTNSTETLYYDRVGISLLAYPWSNTASPFLRFGWASLGVEDVDREDGFLLGVGVDFALSSGRANPDDNMFFRIEYEVSEVGESDFDSIRAGVGWRF